MGNITRIVAGIENRDQAAAEQLLPLVYEELRSLAARQLAREKPGQTLQATALVHDAYVRLVNTLEAQQWNSRGHFFVAAAEAMRRILVERARRKNRVRHGGGRHRIDVDTEFSASNEPDDVLVDLDEALERLAKEDPQSAELVKLRYFAGLTIPQAAQILDISPRKANFVWSFARAWLRRELEQS